MTLHKKIILALLLLLPASVWAQEMPAWQEGWMDIHHIATGKGENSLFVFPDGTTMLVDLGDETNGRFKCPAYPDASCTPAQWVARYIRHFAEGTPGGGTMIDYFALSHLHSDHMGSVSALRPGKLYGLCGATEIGEYIRLGKIVDRIYPDYNGIPAGNSTIPDYEKFIAYQRDSCGASVERFKIGSHSQFGLKYAPKSYKKSFDVHNIASNGYVITGKGNKTRPMFLDSDLSKYDENMLSNVFVISYGPFRYYSGGDLGGGTYSVEQGNWWRDFESQVAEIVGPVTAMKADHHGWKESTNPYMLSLMKPSVVVAFCSHINHPWKTTVQRLADPLYRQISFYTTTDSGRTQVGEELFDAAVKAWGHIVIRVYEGGKSYQIFVLDAKSTDYKVIFTSDIVVL